MFNVQWVSIKSWFFIQVRLFLRIFRFFSFSSLFYAVWVIQLAFDEKTASFFHQKAWKKEIGFVSVACFGRKYFMNLALFKWIEWLTLFRFRSFVHSIERSLVHAVFASAQLWLLLVNMLLVKAAIWMCTFQLFGWLWMEDEAEEKKKNCKLCCADRQIEH